MAFINKIDIKKNEVQKCFDFGICFISRIQQKVDLYQVVRVVFDRYKKMSLKANARANQTRMGQFSTGSLMLQRLVIRGQRVTVIDRNKK